ncbi:phosphotransferase [Chengkuizengella axinellae]|uniref:Phosphotransferase n=1 Tax=Chengkuizengella axinellae TaxID=3064388 RepID=A0ABT9J2G8_9BACL|nr:phosphotransferase [Chengkuizengella sp. 2205SS18-9]MDP5275780.1 phosphotransferase [Chengkuizengella sp. 2205SS18-9]
MKQTLNKIIKKMNLKVLQIDSVPESYSSIVSKLLLTKGEKVILKISHNKRKYHREMNTLKLLKGTLNVPHLLDTFEDEEYVMLLSYIDGLPPQGAINRKLAFEFGENLAKIHSVSLDYYGDINQTNTEDNKKVLWADVINEHFTLWIEDTESYLDRKLHNKCVKFINEKMKLLTKNVNPVVCHYDFRPGNILVQDDHVVGVIDFESSRGGQAEVDFTQMKKYVWERYEGTEESFLSGYKSVRSLPDLENLLPFYEFYNAFGSIAWAIRRGYFNSPEMVTENVNKLNSMFK